MTTKEELKLIEKSMGHLTDCVVEISNTLQVSASECKRREHAITKDRLLDDIHLLTTTIAKNARADKCGKIED